MKKCSSCDNELIADNMVTKEYHAAHNTFLVLNKIDYSINN